MGKGLQLSLRGRALAIALAVGAGGAAAIAKERPGRAIRVERRVVRERPTPRVLSLDDGALRSFGWAPHPGDPIAFLDAQGLAGTGVITTVADPAVACNGRVWRAQYRTDTQNRTFGYGTFAIHGVELTPQARVLVGAFVKAPSERDGENVWVAVDRSGDGDPDMLVSHFSCPDDELGRTLDGAPFCMDGYTREDAQDWQRRSHDVWFACR